MVMGKKSRSDIADVLFGSKFKGSDLVYRNKLNIEQGIMNFEVKYSTIFNI